MLHKPNDCIRITMLNELSKLKKNTHSMILSINKSQYGKLNYIV